MIVIQVTKCNRSVIPVIVTVTQSCNIEENKEGSRTDNIIENTRELNRELCTR